MEEFENLEFGYFMNVSLRTFHNLWQTFNQERQTGDKNKMCFCMSTENEENSHDHKSKKLVSTINT